MQQLPACASASGNAQMHVGCNSKCTCLPSVAVPTQTDMRCRTTVHHCFVWSFVRPLTSYTLASVVASYSLLCTCSMWRQRLLCVGLQAMTPARFSG